MPIGRPVYFEGDILSIEPEAYGFFECKITSPTYIEHPIIQRRIQSSSGLRTVAGLGSWVGVIYSEEMRNAKKYGYSFEVIRGYKFKKGFIFKDYVDSLYNLRKTFDKSHPMNLVAKLLLNSLYGKFGASFYNDTMSILDISSDPLIREAIKKIEKIGDSVKGAHVIENKSLILLLDSSLQYLDEKRENELPTSNTNVGIASAITSMGRVYMSFFKNNPLWRLFYSDTDSIIIDRMLPEKFIGKELGQ